MILTGAEIVRSVEAGEIQLSPFDPSQVNPNSYNYRLGPELRECRSSESGTLVFERIPLDTEGAILRPGRMYLGHTLETIGSRRYSISLIGRSSIGRLGLFVQVSANLGHRGSCHQWTLELVPALPIRVYPEMLIGQVSFWHNAGEFHQFEFTYARLNGVQPSFGVEV
jgi:dCTP deaminase